MMRDRSVSGKGIPCGRRGRQWVTKEEGGKREGCRTRKTLREDERQDGGGIVAERKA